MTDNRRLVKLVRDNVANNLDGSEVRYEPLTREDHIKQLRLKLVEEAVEYLQDPCAEELADVLEVVYALNSFDPAVGGLVHEAMSIKRAQKGAFSRGVGMYVQLKPLTEERETSEIPYNPHS